MNLSELSKETQKKILLGLIILALLVGMLYLVGLPLLRNRREQKVELRDLTAKIRSAETLVNQQSKARAMLEAKSETLAMIAEQMLPPEQNTFVWATERMAGYARRSGVEIDSMNELQPKRPSWDEVPNRKKPERKNKRYFMPYQVKIDLKCNYAELKRFIAAIQNDNKYVSIAALSISAQDETPDSHRATVTVEWPQTKSTAEKSMGKLLAHGLLNKGTD